MMVVFVSECEKRALKKTRRVLDAFGDRIGNNVWQTLITKDGLETVHKMLRETASKSTAVSCHWIRGKSRTELVWIVGNKSKFDINGKVAVNTSMKIKIPEDDIYNWKYLPIIRALACLAALLHDWGKATLRFQKKLDKNYTGSFTDRLRHEWVSCVLLKSFISATDNPYSDNGWLSKLKDGDIDEEKIKQNVRLSFDKPLESLPNIAKLVAWLIVSHHKLPINLNDKYEMAPCLSLDSLFNIVKKNWDYENQTADNFEECLQFPHGLLSLSSKWMSQLKRWAGKLFEYQSLIDQTIDDGSYRVILHHARLSLMLGDHYFSSLDVEQTNNWQKSSVLIANTQNKLPKQSLDQHLVGVCDSAKNIVSKLPFIAHQLDESFNTEELKQKSPKPFSWQDIASKKIRDWRLSTRKDLKGFFAVNIASTGSGKTFANAKIMMALSENGDSLRYILALGLRTLTLQTGDEYKERIFKGGDGTDLAVLIGSKAISDLHYQDKQETENKQEMQGSQSMESLLADDDEVYYEGSLTEEGLTTVLKEPRDRKFLYAPVLVCTIEHIIGATETTRGGRYILPSLRLLSSDLVIDEVDDFTGEDLIAIGRLIHLAGMLGRKVMISSATIPPAMAEGYFNAYSEGWSLYCKTQNAKSEVGCAWVDEFTTKIDNIYLGQDSNQKFNELHKKYIDKRVANLNQEPAKRKAIIINCEKALNAQEDGSHFNKKKLWCDSIVEAILNMHERHHSIDNVTGLNISFGVVRIANIQPCVQVTKYLLEFNWPNHTEVRVMAYHSRQVLLLRHVQEKHLDKVLKRKEKKDAVPIAFEDAIIRKHIDGIFGNKPDVKNLIFIVVATPVEEVGRDHDFDWAIIEPSSYRSIIQLAGRVRRHRSDLIGDPNIGILQYNWRTIKDGDKERKPRFYYPGYEPGPGSGYTKLTNGKHSCFKTHDVYKLVDVNLIKDRLDSVPRIQEQQSASKTPMALLEHAVIDSQLRNYEDGKGPETLQGYIKWCWFLTALPQKLNSFRKITNNSQLYRVVNEKGDAWFTERDSQGNFVYTINGEFSKQDDFYRIEFVDLDEAQTARLWMKRDYLELLEEQMNKQDITLQQAVMRYGEITIDSYQHSTNSNTIYEYNDQLGLYQKEINNG